jgi:hypothetical protein
MFHIWQGNLLTKIALNAGLWGIPAAALAAVQTAQARWEAAFTVAGNPATRTPAAVKEKQEARATYEAALRPLIKAYLTYSRLVTDAGRRDLGLPVHDTKPTPVGPITSRPEPTIDTASIQKHTLHAVDSVSKKAARPHGVAGIQIWRKLGDPAPTADSDWSLVAQPPRLPYTLNYDLSESGLRVYYRLRWMNTRGVPGEWSETVAAFIT